MSTTDETLVKHFGIGKSEFAAGAGPQTGMALDLVTQAGERGAVFGPMRSMMFVSDPDTLTKAGYQGSLLRPIRTAFTAS